MNSPPLNETPHSLTNDPCPLSLRTPHFVHNLFMQLSESTRIKVALTVALSADFLQIIFLPMFIEGVFSPLDDVLDVAVGATLWALLGWHYSFLPALIAESIPGLDLVPTWTVSALLAIKSKKRAPTGQGVVIDV